MNHKSYKMVVNKLIGENDKTLQSSWIKKGKIDHEHSDVKSNRKVSSDQVQSDKIKETKMKNWSKRFFYRFRSIKLKILGQSQSIILFYDG